MKKKKISFPSALTVLFIVLIFAAILTAIVPAGLYSKLTYNADHDVFEITTPDGDVTEMAPTQETLDELGVTGNLNKFLGWKHQQTNCRSGNLSKRRTTATGSIQNPSRCHQRCI